MTRTAQLFLMFAAFALSAFGQDSEYPPDLPGARVETYKSVDGVDLKLWIYTPEGHNPGDQAPAIVFFFGGGFRSGNPSQFWRQSHYLASRGMVAATADYRVLNRHGVKANKCVADAKSAIRWMRKNANRLGIDPDRIAAAGGSSGGHLAAATATLPGHDDPADELSISAKPNALVLFNPGLVRAPIPGKHEMTTAKLASEKERMGAELESTSPYHHVASGLPPAIIFHGKADTTVPYERSDWFAEKMKHKGNRCELVGYEGAKHGFFNYARDREAFRDTVRRMDMFLTSLGYLKGEPQPISED